MTKSNINKCDLHWLFLVLAYVYSPIILFCAFLEWCLSDSGIIESWKKTWLLFTKR